MVGPNVFRAFLAQDLNAGQASSTIKIDRITTLTGESISTASFSTFARGIISINPDADGQNSFVEFASFTGIDTNNLELTGVTRGLSALSNSSNSSRMRFFPVGTQIVISFGTHDILDLIEYINNAVVGGVGTASDTTAGTVKLTENMSTRARVYSALVKQQAVPDMTLSVIPFSLSTLGEDIEFAGGNTPTFTAPTSDPRIDLVVYDTGDSAIEVRTGSEAPSPTKPTPDDGDIVLCSVYLRPSSTEILERDDSTNSYIDKWYIPHVYNTALAGGGDFGTPSSTNKFVTEEFLNNTVFNFGDGSDGDVVISSPTTLTRDMYYNNLTVNSTLTTNGFRIYVKETIDGTGTIAYPTPNNGTNGTTGSTGSGGAGANAFSGTSYGTLLNVPGSGGGGGGVSGDTSTGGAAGTGGVGTSFAGAGGGSGNAGAGGPGASRLIGNANNTGGSGGQSGGSGSGTVFGGGGGGGGASGGPIVIYAKNWEGTFALQSIGGNGGAGGNGIGFLTGGTVINGASGGTGGSDVSISKFQGYKNFFDIMFLHLNQLGTLILRHQAGAPGGGGGARGGSSVSSGGGGGGAGGAGGFAVVFYINKTWTGTTNFTGGTGGAGGSSPNNNNGQAGGNGITGFLLEVQIEN